MNWPSKSPDSNFIENLWPTIDIKSRKRSKQPSNIDELFRILQDEWRRVDKDLLENLVESMPKRCKSVL